MDIYVFPMKNGEQRGYESSFPTFNGLRQFVGLCGHLSAMMLDCFSLCRSVVRRRGTTGSVIEVDLTGEL